MFYFNRSLTRISHLRARLGPRCTRGKISQSRKNALCVPVKGPGLHGAHRGDENFACPHAYPPHRATSLWLQDTCSHTCRPSMWLSVATILALGAAASPVSLEAAAGFEAVASKLAGQPSKLPDVVKSRLKLVKLHCAVLTNRPQSWACTYVYTCNLPPAHRT